MGYLLLRRTKPKRTSWIKDKDIQAVWPSLDEKDFLVDGEPVPSLKMDNRNFLLDGKPFRILSGAIHYFRVVPEYWKDRLLKLKGMGLNTVETYVPWNLHEEVKGQFKFDGSLNIRAFITLAQRLQLFVIVRPGPYICSEWDFGGLPSWLLHDPEMKPRSMYPPFIKATKQYFKRLLPILEPLQFYKGGPIIAFQVENEYGSFNTDDVEYMEYLRSLMIGEGIKELLFTSDNYHGLQKQSLAMPDVLQTINFGGNAWERLKEIKQVQPDKPVLVTEFWDGWFDHWGEEHHTREKESVASSLEEILLLGASFNLYMFHGGTNFGFMNGANSLQPTTTSYDYDAPLSEAGDITPKYIAMRDVLKNHAPKHSVLRGSFELLRVLKNSPKMSYGRVRLDQYMSLSELLQFHVPIESDWVMPMEQLPINNNGGQGYGFVLYQTETAQIPREISIDNVLDRAQVMLNSLLVHTYDASLENTRTAEVKIDDETAKQLKRPCKLQILVENMGRSNYGADNGVWRKGISGAVLINAQSHTELRWKIFSLEFKPDVLSRIQRRKWKALSENQQRGPALYRGTFTINGKPKDTFLSMTKWTKGVCFINGHNLGRYWERGPQQTLYVPAPWLQKGKNEIIVFELHSFSSAEVSFEDTPMF